MESIRTFFNKCFRAFQFKNESETLYPRFLRFINESHRDGVMGDGRYAVALGKAEKLRRFLVITDRQRITAEEFTTDILLEFRQYVYDEYKYVTLYPGLYPSGAGHRAPKKRLRDTTVVHDMKLLQALFNELENTDDIRRSPFRKISMEKRRVLMHVMYDAPIFLRGEELRRVMKSSVPMNLQWAKNIFVLNCAIGCRISDLLRLSMANIGMSEDGIPYVHYMPSKTARLQSTNLEVTTPLIEPAVDIINSTGLKLMGMNHHYGKQRYNKALRDLLKFCDITRQVSLFNPESGNNEYRPLCEVASSKLARKTHIDMLNKVQINYYAAGLHRAGSDAVFRYTNLELKDRYELMRVAFGI